MKRAPVHTYEIFTRDVGAERMVLRSCNLKTTQHTYLQMLSTGGAPRLRVDGIELSLEAADKLMRSGLRTLPSYESHK